MSTVTAVHREVVVDAPLEAAWDHFARATAWPSWATYIKDVVVSPPGPLGPTSVATIHLHKGPSTTFRMAEFAAHRHWRWKTRALWLTLDYDHRFDAVGDHRTRIVLHIDVVGFGAGLLAGVIGKNVGPTLDAALPRLALEMKALGRHPDVMTP